MNPAFLPRPFHDALLDHLDRDRRLIDTQHARRFTRRWTNPSREFRKIVRRMQTPDRALPAIVVRQVVPVGNQVVHRASGVAEGHPAIHAARALVTLLLDRKRLVNFEPVLHPFFHFAARWLLALDFEKSGDLTHVSPRLRPPESMELWFLHRPSRPGPRRAP